MISMRILLKSTPGTVVLHSVTGRLGALSTVPFPFSLWGTGTAVLDRSVFPAAANQRVREHLGPSRSIKDRYAGTSPGPIGVSLSCFYRFGQCESSC